MLKRKSYYLVDLDHGKTQEKIDRYCEVASRVAIWYGPDAYTEERIDEFWNDSSYPPSERTLLQGINNSHMKWYLNNKIIDYEEIWNGSFICGLTQYGKVHWGKFRFPTFKWLGSRNLYDLLQECPYYGKVVWEKPRYWHRWVQVPALYLPADKNSNSFMAGVLATGEIFNNYVRYNKHVGSILKSWGIPFEKTSPQGQYVYISPIWPAIMSLYMPNKYGERWKTIAKAANAEFYAAILWRIYSKTMAVSKAMPYLPTNRTIYSKYGNVKTLEKKRVELNLVNLDCRIEQTVRKWSAQLDLKNV